MTDRRRRGAHGVAVATCLAPALLPTLPAPADLVVEGLTADG